ncbi:Cof-type HAD-IIB family hydrolase [Paenibacillus agilis]|uniref:HAD family phosphatase n=1 Tax=Paenibacillus agilis TaxID=3020863 RepID=A0A559IY97_9BACL|nr:Cof-type HAD-IIB family hydrolase [Paenibacillus agilis]TVX92600.1 HAD family phosphatase [Paenibacillus agilis]
MNNIKMIALDMDGTLLHDDHSLSEMNANTIREVAAQGVEIVLCTGRSPVSTLPYLDKLGLEGVVITHNGAATVASKDKSMLHQFELSQMDLEPYLTYCNEEKVHYDINTAFDLYVNQVDLLSADWLNTYKQFLIEPKNFPGWDNLASPVLKLTMSGYKEDIDRVQQALSLWDHKVQFIRSGDFFIDIMHKEATKGNALKQLTQLRGISSDNVMAVGNYYNDMTMIQFAGIGVAMDNSPIDVKAAADEVTLSNNDDGVHAVLKKYFLS